MKAIDRMHRHKELVLFVVCGGTAAAVNVGARVVLSRFVGFETAVVIAYAIGMLTAFLLNRALVFKAPARSLKHQAFWFVVINLVAALQTLVVSVVLERWLLPWVGWTWQPELTAHMVGVVVPIATSYLGHKYITFQAH